MTKIYRVICGKYKKFKILKHHTFSKKALVFLLFALTLKIKMKKYLKKKNHLRYYKFLVLLKVCIYFKNMVEENICLVFKFKNMGETRCYFVK